MELGFQTMEAGQLRLDFAATERPSWRHSGRATSDMVEDILKFCRRYEKLSQGDRSWADTEYYEQALAEFLFQVNNIEKEGFDTFEETLDAIAGGALARDVPDDGDSRMVSLFSLNKALRHWFPECSQTPCAVLSIEELEMCHKLLLGSSAPEIAGSIRKKEEQVVFTKTEDGMHLFTWPTEVEKRLSMLFSQTSQALERLRDRELDSVSVWELFRVSGAFFLEFESIHPFLDGNGRCGRVILAYLLRTLMPFPNVLLVDRAEYGHPPFVAPVYYYDCFQDAQSEQTFETGKDGKPIFTKEAAEQCELGMPMDLTALIIEGVYVAWRRFFSALESRQQQPNKKRKLSSQPAC